MKRYTHPIFTAALLTIARIWKQPKYPSIHEWIKKMWYIYMMEYYSAIKRNKQCHYPFFPSLGSCPATWVDLEIIILSEVIRQRKTNTI